MEDGQLISGIVCKKTVGASAGSLLHIAMLEQGYVEAGKYPWSNRFLWVVKHHSIDSLEFYRILENMWNYWKDTMLFEGHDVVHTI